MTTTVVLPIAVIVVLVLVNGVFVAAEFSLVGSRRSRLVSQAEAGSRAARWLVAVFDRPTGKDGYIAVAQLGITLASIGLGMYGEPAVAGWLYGPFEDWGLSSAASHTVGFIVALSAITYLHVVIGEMIPKALALQAPEQVSLRVNPVMRTFGSLFRPMVVVLNAVALALMRLLRIPEPDKRFSLHTSAELAIVTDEAADSGQLGAVQRDLIRNIFDLGGMPAEQMMTSLSRLEVLDVSASAEDVNERITMSPRSRYPVVDGSLDRVLGVVHIKDVIRAEQAGTVVLEQLVRPLPTVAATTTAERLLAMFKADRTHACLVVDEFGSTLGFVTLDDVVAEVMDDHVLAGSHAIEQAEDGSFVLDGEVTLSDVEERLGVELTHPEVTTVAGLVLAEHGTVPEPGATLVVGGVRLTVDEVRGVKITRVRLRRLAADD